MSLSEDESSRSTPTPSLNGDATHTTTAVVNTDAIPTHFAPVSLRLVLTGFSLGSLFGVAAILSIPFFVASASETHFIGPQFWMYLTSWATFHMMEFIVTAGWNPTRLMKDSFLLQNGWNYHAAHVAGMVEFLIESYFYSSFKTISWINYVGLMFVLFGQTVRSLSMIQAADNFSHQVASKKRQDHRLVQSGLYSVMRHPSYNGFYFWAVGTQLLLGNPVCIFVFLGVLWRFFSSRIYSEEDYLISFFGKEYHEYRRNVWSGIPFVR
ncbi:unnamed protein product [Sympodiomycopsis kandeliae]